MISYYFFFILRFCKQYAAVGPTIVKALEDYAHEVRSGTFPDPEKHCYPMEEGEIEKFNEWSKKYNQK